MVSLSRLAVTLALVAAAAGTHANPITATADTSKGTWWGTNGTDGTLKARDINGNAVALNDSSAAFFYDSALGITWLANMNAGAGTDFDKGPSCLAGFLIYCSDGLLRWQDALKWADALEIGGFKDWRLPKLGPVDGISFQATFSTNGSTDNGMARTGEGWGISSELGHLYYVTLGNRGQCEPNDANPGVCVEQLGWKDKNVGYFQNVKVGYNGYWYGIPTATSAWAFDHYTGWQGPEAGTDGQFVVAVRDGDVLSVPEPSSLALALAGIGIGIALRRRRTA